MNAVLRRFWGLGLALGVSLSANAAVTGTVTTVGGYLAGMRDGDNLVSQFRNPRGLAVDPNGFLYVADFGNNRIRIVNPATEVTSTFANTGLSGPTALAFDAQGRLYVVNAGGYVVRYEGSSANNILFADGFSNPTAIALDEDSVYVAQADGTIFRFSTTGVNNGTFFVGDGGTSVAGLTAPGNGTLVISDSGNHVLWSMPISGGTATVLAGAYGDPGFADGTGTSARFNSPQHIASTTNGIVVVADQKNHRVRAVNNVGLVTTLYGVNPATWIGRNPAFLPGWTDGSSASAELRDPVGVAVARNGTVFDSEVYYHLIRMATGLTFPTNFTSGGGTNGPGGGGTITNVTSGNRISLGFGSGEGSSDFVAAVGQHFIAPVTLSVVQDTRIYGMQLNMTLQNTTGPNGTVALSFDSMFKAPDPVNPGAFYTIDPQAFIRTAEVAERVTNFVDGVGVISIVIRQIGVFNDLVFTNSVGNMMSVGWLERFQMTNLYNTLQHDLIRFSQAHDTLFNSGGGKVVVGGFGFTIPPGAVGNQYEVRLGRPSANGDGVQSDVVIDAPNDPAGPISAVRRLAIASRPYLVGDVLPFRWFNAGEFGDGSILNNDMEQIHQTAGYGVNMPPRGSDMFDALDSCCVTAGGIDYSSYANLFSVSGAQALPDFILNEIAYGDGNLNLADIYVTFRRSLDPALTNYLRFWTNGALAAVATPNTFRGVAGDGATTTKKAKSYPFDVARSEEAVTAKIVAKSIFAQPGFTARVPLQLNVTGPLTARSIRFRLKVLGLDGFSVVPDPISFSPSAAVGTPWKGGVIGTNVFDGIWFELASGFAAGSHDIGTINVKIPSDATADTIFGVEFESAEVAAGITMFPTTTQNAIVIMPNRATQPWTDEIPDEWRIQYFGSLMNILSAPDADADGDGLTTLEEYRAGTNPNDVGSLLALSGTSGVSAITLTWPTVAGKTYRLESSPALVNPNWTVVEQGIVGNGGSMQRSRPLDSNARFFRVIAQ